MSKTSPSNARTSTQRVKRVLFDSNAFDSNMIASFTCPNCDGDVTEADHDAFGICGDCYYAVAEHVQHEHECMH